MYGDTQLNLLVDGLDVATNGVHTSSGNRYGSSESKATARPCHRWVTDEAVGRLLAQVLAEGEFCGSTVPKGVVLYVKAKRAAGRGLTDEQIGRILRSWLDESAEDLLVRVENAVQEGE